MAAGVRALLAGPWWSRGFLLLAIVACACAVARGVAAWQQTQANQRISAGAALPGDDPRVLFAQAVALDHRGRIDEAMSAYAETEALGSPVLRHAVRVNVANLHLRQGIAAAREEGGAQRAMALLLLAKSGLRRALREDPDDWNARYNLELATRVLPDFEARSWRRSGDESEIEEALRKDKPAWTEMIGQPRGMH